MFYMSQNSHIEGARRRVGMGTETLAPGWRALLGPWERYEPI
jgi:hypothetical protein